MNYIHIFITMITIIQWKNNLESDVKINIKLSKLKPLHSDWLVKLYHEMQSKGELIRKGFDKSGITDALNMDNLMPENPFDDEDM